MMVPATAIWMVDARRHDGSGADWIQKDSRCEKRNDSVYEPDPVRTASWQSLSARAESFEIGRVGKLELAACAGFISCSSFTNRAKPDRKSTRLNSSHLG